MNGYDSVKAPRTFDPRIDYWCFTDRPEDVHGPWRPLSADVIGLNAKDSNRFVKMHPHRMPQIADYDVTVYVDGSIEIVGDLMPLLDSCAARPETVQMFRHPFRDCLYDEALACARSGHDTVFTIGQQMRRYRGLGFPANHGLFEANVIYRRHGPEVESMMQAWWSEYRAGARRDQLSLPYVAWRCGLKIGDMGPSDPRFGQQYFRLQPHRAKRVPWRTSANSRINRALLGVLGATRFIGHE